VVGACNRRNHGVSIQLNFHQKQFSKQVTLFHDNHQSLACARPGEHCAHWPPRASIGVQLGRVPAADQAAARRRSESGHAAHGDLSLVFVRARTATHRRRRRPTARARSSMVGAPSRTGLCRPRRTRFTADARGVLRRRPSASSLANSVKKSDAFLHGDGEGMPGLHAGADTYRRRGWMARRTRFTADARGVFRRRPPASNPTSSLATSVKKSDAFLHGDGERGRGVARRRRHIQAASVDGRTVVLEHGLCILVKWGFFNTS
jgi:hypothetical protein